ncbi:hypothetical protein VPH35_025685 [Triticum aestivum]
MAHTTLQGTAVVQFRGKPLFNNGYAEAFLWMCISPESRQLFNLLRTFLVEFNASADVPALLPAPSPAPPRSPAPTPVSGLRHALAAGRGRDVPRIPTPLVLMFSAPSRSRSCQRHYREEGSGCRLRTTRVKSMVIV